MKKSDGFLRDSVKVIQFNLRAFFSVRTWPWMMLFYKLRPMLRSAQVEKELATLNEDFSKLKDAFDRSVAAYLNCPKISPLLCFYSSCIFLPGVK